MNRAQQVEFCKICEHRKPDIKQGLICGLTNAKADFEVSCENFSKDYKAQVYYKQQKKGVREETRKETRKETILFIITIVAILSRITVKRVNSYNKNFFQKYKTEIVNKNKKKVNEKQIAELNKKLKQSEQSKQIPSTNSSAKKTVSLSDKITIKSVELAGVDNNNNVAYDFGKVIFSTKTNYIRVRMNFNSSLSGKKEFTVKLLRRDNNGYRLYNSITQKVKMNSNSVTFDNIGLPDKQKLPSGKYVVKILCEDEELKSEEFTIY